MLGLGEDAAVAGLGGDEVDLVVGAGAGEGGDGVGAVGGLDVGGDGLGGGGVDVLVYEDDVDGGGVGAVVGGLARMMGWEGWGEREGRGEKVRRRVERVGRREESWK